jgi:hypothetical protein
VGGERGGRIAAGFLWLLLVLVDAEGQTKPIGYPYKSIQIEVQTGLLLHASNGRFWQHFVLQEICEALVVHVIMYAIRSCMIVVTSERLRTMA